MTGVEAVVPDPMTTEGGDPAMIQADVGSPGTVPDLWPNETDDRKLWVLFSRSIGFLRVLRGTATFAWSGQ